MDEENNIGYIYVFMTMLRMGFFRLQYSTIRRKYDTF